MAEERKRHISEALKEHYKIHRVSEEIRFKQSLAMKGKPLNPARRQQHIEIRNKRRKPNPPPETLEEKIRRAKDNKLEYRPAHA